jgi:hypothetical protein
VTRRTFVVGDVHGCLTELEALLAKAGFTAGARSEDQLVLAGDLVARGPDSQGVVQLARERGALAVLGNHDAHLLAVHSGHSAKLSRLKPKHLALAESMGPADWEYLRALPLFLEFPELNTVIVHAGLLPAVPLAEQPREVLLNLRSFDARGQPSTRVDGGVPWASRWVGPRRVVFGHDALRGLQRYPLALGLDTGCVYGNALSGVWLPELKVVQVRATKVWKEPDGP